MNAGHAPKIKTKKFPLAVVLAVFHRRRLSAATMGEKKALLRFILGKPVSEGKDAYLEACFQAGPALLMHHPDIKKSTPPPSSDDVSAQTVQTTDINVIAEWLHQQEQILGTTLEIPKSKSTQTRNQARNHRRNKSRDRQPA